MSQPPDTFVDEMMAPLEALMRFARSLTRDPADADDLVQETYLRAFRSWSTYQPGTGARQWLFTICRNAYLRASRRSLRMVTVEDDAELNVLASVGLHVAAQSGGYDDIFDRAELRAAISTAVAKLPDAHRVVVAMIDVEGRSYAETADALEIPVGTVRSRLFRARRILQEDLIEFARDAGVVRDVEEFT
ncbi:MAG: sigma-70 family RNA polymerase sigma factor [bacterium]